MKLARELREKRRDPSRIALSSLGSVCCGFLLTGRNGSLKYLAALRGLSNWSGLDCALLLLRREGRWFGGSLGPVEPSPDPAPSFRVDWIGQGECVTSQRETEINRRHERENNVVDVRRSLSPRVMNHAREIAPEPAVNATDLSIRIAGGREHGLLQVRHSPTTAAQQGSDQTNDRKTSLIHGRACARRARGAP